MMNKKKILFKSVIIFPSLFIFNLAADWIETMENSGALASLPFYISQLASILVFLRKFQAFVGLGSSWVGFFVFGTTILVFWQAFNPSDWRQPEKISSPKPSLINETASQKKTNDVSVAAFSTGLGALIGFIIEHQGFSHDYTGLTGLVFFVSMMAGLIVSICALIKREQYAIPVMIFNLFVLHYFLKLMGIS